MKIFGGGGKHAGSGRSVPSSQTIPRPDTGSLPDLDDILAEIHDAEPSAPVQRPTPTQRPTEEKLQEMREYVPAEPGPEEYTPTKQQAPRPVQPHISGYTTFEDDAKAAARPASAQSTPRAQASRPTYSTASQYSPSNASLGRGIDPANVHLESGIRGYVKPDSAPSRKARLATQAAQQARPMPQIPAMSPASPEPPTPEKKKKRRRWPFTVGAAALVIAGLYCLCVFSQIPFIAKWRAIYIETAMGTMTHQWLATAFIPRSIIEDVMYERWKLEEQQQQIESNKDLVSLSTTTLGAMHTSATTTPAATTGATTQATTTTATTAPPTPEWELEDYPLYALFPELDRQSFIDYANDHADTLYTDDGHIMIDEAGRDQAGTEIMTTNGHQVLALDTKNGILIIKVTGEDSDEHYEGKLVFVRDPSQVKLGVAKNLGSVGQQAGQIAARYDAILAINASGFQDDDGHGNGGIAYGFVLSEGKRYQSAIGGNYKCIAFDEDNILHITNYKSSLNLRDGAEFRPALIINGKIQVTGSAGWGIHPRTVIGQAEDGTVMMLVVDGRQTHSMGITIGECAKIMASYGAVQACNLDGGSSSVLYYNGRVISNPSGADKVNGRYLPDAFIVMPATQDTEVTA